MDTHMATSGGFNLLIDLANVPAELQQGIAVIANNTLPHKISLYEDDDLQDVEFHWLLRYVLTTTTTTTTTNPRPLCRHAPQLTNFLHRSTPRRFEKDPGLSEGECSVMVDPLIDTSVDQKRLAIVVKYNRRIEGKHC